MAAGIGAAPFTAPPSPSAPERATRHFLSRTLPPLLVLAAALLVAGRDYVDFLHHDRQLWAGTIHDRHAHYLTALGLAHDLRHADFVQGLHDFDRVRVWPPLHALLAAVVLAVGGPDYRLAVLPSLLAFVGTVLLGFLVARRAAPRGGNFAGLLAALLLLTSSAHRAFATDIMLESLGACLSLLVLYLYLATLQSTSGWLGWALGLALTALFLTKYNYWTIVVAALVLAELWTRPRIYRRMLADVLASFDLRRFLAAELRRPSNYLLAEILVLIAWGLLCDSAALYFGDRCVPLHSPHLLILAAYALVLGRVALAWRQRRQAILSCLDERARPLLAWHCWPMALWFLWPARLSLFLWYMSPAQTGEHPDYPLLHSAGYYWKCWIDDYSPGLAAALLLLGLIGVTALLVRRLRPGGRVLLCFMLIGVALCMLHPNRKSRFLHSWIAGAWTSAGVGLVGLTHGRLTRRIPAARPWLATAVIVGFGAVCLPSLAQAGRAPEGGPSPRQLSGCDLTDCYLPSLAGSHDVMVLSNLPMKFFARWTFLERYGRRYLDTEIHNFTSMTPVMFEHWLQTMPDDTVVFVDVQRDSCFYEYVPECERLQPLGDLLETQTVFVRRQRWYLLRHGCTVTVWQRSRAQCISK